MVEIGRRGLMLVLSSPSGAGKTTISRKLLAIERERMMLSVSVTTRKARPGEVEGRDYYFIDQKKFAAMVAKDELLEHANVFGNMYGTPRAAVDKALAKPGAVGRQLDFLAQEFNREANTLCSKSADVELTRIGLDLKTTIDQFREQIQNVE